MAQDRDSSAEKSQEPTQKRLDEAREQGNIARSRELNTTAILLGGTAAMIMFGGAVARGLSGIMQHNFALERAAFFDTAAMLRQLGDSIYTGLLSLLPVFIMLLVLAFLAPIGLGGWNFSLKSVAPQASRLNPLSGLSRMFGGNAVVELLKAVAKVLVVASIALLILAMNTEDILNTQHEAVLPAIADSVELIAWSVLWMSCAMILISAVDIPFQIYQHSQTLYEMLIRAVLE